MGFFLKLEKSGIGWNELRAFDIELFRFVPSQGRAYVDTSEQLRRERGDTVLLNDTPKGEVTFAVFRVSFKDGAKDLLPSVRFTDAEGAMVRYEGGLRLAIDLVHGSRQSPGQCTVFCSTTGDSRTCPHACIECHKGQSVVRICC